VKTVKEVEMDIGGKMMFFVYDEKTESTREITIKEFNKLKTAKQIEVLLNTIMLLHSLLREDLLSIWKRIDKIEDN